MNLWEKVLEYNLIPRKASLNIGWIVSEPKCNFFSRYFHDLYNSVSFVSLGIPFILWVQWIVAINLQCTLHIYHCNNGAGGTAANVDDNGL